jgi:hypothetical protein
MERTVLCSASSLTVRYWLGVKNCGRYTGFTIAGEATLWWCWALVSANAKLQREKPEKVPAAEARVNACSSSLRLGP